MPETGTMTDNGTMTDSGTMTDETMPVYETMPADGEVTWDIRRVICADKAGFWIHKLPEEVGTLYERDSVNSSTRVVKREGVNKKEFDSSAYMGSFKGDEATATLVGDEIIMKVEMGLTWVLPALWVQQVYGELRDTLGW